MTGQHGTDASDISVIVVNYGTADLAIAAVKSVLNLTHGRRRVDVHLLDNASPGDDAARFKEVFDTPAFSGRVTLYPNPENLGFGQGNNVVLKALAARMSPPEYVFLLNPDACLENDAINILADFLHTHRQAAGAGAHIRLPDGTAVTAAFRFPSAMGEFARAANFGPLDRLLKRWRMSLSPDLPETAVDWVAGAAVMFRYKVIEDMNGFDKDFFLYYEEVELMHRIRRAGHEIWYVPEACVIHIEGASTQISSRESQRPTRPSYWYDSWRHYYTKTHGRSGALLAAAAWIGGATLDRGISALRRQDPKMPHHFFRNAWRFILVPLIGLQKKSG